MPSGLISTSCGLTGSASTLRAASGNGSIAAPSNPRKNCGNGAACAGPISCPAPFADRAVGYSAALMAIEPISFAFQSICVPTASASGCPARRATTPRPPAGGR